MIIEQRYLDLNTPDIASLLGEWKRRWPRMGVLVLLPESEKCQIERIQATARSCQVPLSGAVFPALLNATGFITTGAWFLCMEIVPARFLVDGLAHNGVEKLTQAIQGLDRTVQSPKGMAPTLFLIFDGMLPHIGTLLEGVHQVFDDTLLYAGVNAGSETFAPMPCLFDEHSILSEGALGLLLPNAARVVLHHGYPVSKRLMEATSTVGNRIDTIDHRPALEVYQNVIAQEYGVTLTRENFYDHAVHFPFGVITAVDVLVRIPVAFNDDGSLVCVGEVPPNTLLRLLRAPELENSDCIAKISNALTRSGYIPQPLLTFYCAGRRMHFGVDAVKELVQLQTETSSPNIAGALTLGEIDSMEDLMLPRFHNAALLCLTNTH